MSFFASGPPEVISCIFQSCHDFADVLALATSCQRLNAIWVSDKANIFWQVGRSTVLSFDEALIAVRATEIVKTAHIAGVLSPEIQITSLSGNVQKPTLTELKAVLDLRHYVRFLEYLLFRRKNTASTWGYGAKHLLDESPHLLESWRSGFYRAAYRFFIAGAVLSRAFLEPFFTRKEDTPKDFLSNFIYSIDWLERSDSVVDRIDELPMSDDELQYLNTNFPVYNFTTHDEGWEGCFGQLGDWLVGSTRKRLSDEQKLDANRAPDATNSEQAVLREIMQLLVFYGQLCEMKGGIWGPFAPFWSKHYLNSNGVCMCYSGTAHRDESGGDSDDVEEEYDVNSNRGNEGGGNGDEDIADDTASTQHQNVDIMERVADEDGHVDDNNNTPPPPRQIRPTREIAHVNLGLFQPSESQVSDVRVFDETSYIGENKLMPCSSKGPRFPSIDLFAEILHCKSERPNRVNRHPAPHPPLHLFSFILRKHFGYRFDEGAFEMNCAHPVYENFLRGGKIFAGGEGSWDGMLASVIGEEAQVWSYAELGWGYSDC